MNNSKYQVADTYNYQLTPEEQMSLQYDSKSKFREALVAQSNGEISYKEAGEIFDSVRENQKKDSPIFIFSDIFILDGKEITNGNTFTRTPTIGC